MQHIPGPLVTIGIPTYRRPELLERALHCVARQDYGNIELIVADNCTPGTAVEEIIERFRPKIDKLLFIKHPKNIGSFANFFSLLDAASGKYFMWLADDDEISPNYVSALVGLLEANPRASSAAGHWIAMENEGTRDPRTTSSFPQQSALIRALKFIWRTDDAFFYGLHRTSVIRQATFPGYWWPNKGVLLNWGYVFLLDMVLRGPILLPSDSSVQFVNHHYTSKFYATGGGGFLAMSRFVARRLNVHYLYLTKTAKTIGAWAVLPAFFVSLAALCREVWSYFGDGALLELRRFRTDRNSGFRS